MKSFTYTINDELGIHARPAGVIAKEAKNYTSTITIEGNGKSAEAVKLIALMGLGVKKGVTVTVKADGADEAQAIAAMEALFKANL